MWGDALDTQMGVASDYESSLGVATFRKYNNLFINHFA
jgi:hypothetical protein